MKKKAFLISLSIFLCFSIAVVLCCIFIKPPTSENTPTPDVPDAFHVYDENGDVIKSNANTIFKPGEKYTFTTSYDDFTFAIIPNASDESTDFGFKVNDKTYKFRALGDLTKQFDVELKENSISLYIKENQTVLNVIKGLFPGETIDIMNENVKTELERGSNFYFSLRLQSNFSIFYLNFGITENITVILPSELIF